MNVTEHNTHGLVPSKLSISPNVVNNLVTEPGQMLSFYYIDSKLIIEILINFQMKNLLLSGIAKS